MGPLIGPPNKYFSFVIILIFRLWYFRFLYTFVLLTPSLLVVGYILSDKLHQSRYFSKPGNYGQILYVT